MGLEQKNKEEKQESELSSEGTREAAKNPNPRANENIRVSSEPPSEDTRNSAGVGSEITDGEDA